MKQENSGGMLRLYEILRGAAVTRRAVRFYEEQGLLLPAGRDQYGRRIYVHSDLMRLKLIRALRTAGLSIAAIRDVLDARAVRPEDSSQTSWIQRVEQVLSHYSEQMRQQLIAMQEGEAEMLRALGWMQSHRDEDIRDSKAAEDTDMPFIVKALLCQPSTLATAPPTRAVGRADEGGVGFTAPAW